MKPIVDKFSEPQSFEVTSGALRVTDPCYSVDIWCSGQLENVKNGTWHAKVGYHNDPMDEQMAKRCFDREREAIEASMKRFEDSMKKNRELTEEDRAHIEAIRADQLARLEEKIEAAKNYPGRVSVIGIAHESISFGELEKYNWQRVQDLHVGVDSGQAGFFDLVKYTEAVSDKHSNGGRNHDGGSFDTFYKSVCELTLADASWGVVPFGAVSSSGYGDGGYSCFVLRNPTSDPTVSELVGAYIVFISEEEEEEEE